MQFLLISFFISFEFFICYLYYFSFKHFKNLNKYFVKTLNLFLTHFQMFINYEYNTLFSVLIKWNEQEIILNFARN